MKFENYSLRKSNMSFVIVSWFSCQSVRGCAHVQNGWEAVLLSVPSWACYWVHLLWHWWLFPAMWIYICYSLPQLVDLALLVRQDMVSKAGDPFSHAISATFIQYHSSAEVSIRKCDESAFVLLLLVYIRTLKWLCRIARSLLGDS